MADQSPLINPTGKQQLMSDKRLITGHRELMQNPQMRVSLNLALLQYQHMLAVGAVEANGAAASMFKIRGAEEFVDILLKLAESTALPETQKVSKLDFNS